MIESIFSGTYVARILIPQRVYLTVDNLEAHIRVIKKEMLINNDMYLHDFLPLDILE